MGAPAYSVADYTAAVQSLLPRGRVWTRDPDSTLTKVAKAIAAIYERNNARANALLVDAFPKTAVELLPEWQNTLGVTDLAGTLLGQQQQVVRALIALGGQSKPYFIALLADLGRTATITEYERFTVRDPIGTPIYGDGWCHGWRVSLTGGYSASVETLIRKLAPAHTAVVFTYV